MLAAAALAVRVSAQTAITPASSAAEASALPLVDQAAAALAPGASPAARAAALFRTGLIGLRPAFDYSFVHADGIQQARGRPLATNIQTTSLGLSTDIGPNWNVSYLPAWVVYSNPAFRDNVEQHLALTGAVFRPAWSASISQAYGRMDTPIVETGSQTAEQMSTTSLGFRWRWPANLNFNATLGQNLTFLDKLPDRYEWTAAPEIDYQPVQQLLIGVGCTVGYVFVYHGPNSTYTRPMAHVQWQLTRKTALNASVGLDRWHFLAGNHSTTTSLYYAVGAAWNPFATTAVNITALRTDSAGLLRGEMSRTTGTSITLQQRLLGLLWLNLGMDRQRTAYLGAVAPTESRRSDQLRSYTASLSVPVLQRGSLSLFYRASYNGSTASGFGFASHQFGFEFGFKY